MSYKIIVKEWETPKADLPTEIPIGDLSCKDMQFNAWSFEVNGHKYWEETASSILGSLDEKIMIEQFCETIEPIIENIFGVAMLDYEVTCSDEIIYHQKYEK